MVRWKEWRGKGKRKRWRNKGSEEGRDAQERDTQSLVLQHFKKSQTQPELQGYKRSMQH